MDQKYREYMLAQLKALVSIDSPSGYTEEVELYLMDELSRMGYAPRRWVKGGVSTYLAGEGDPIMLLAHVDTLGAMVDYVKPDGRLLLSNVGGLQANNVETENVRVRTRFDGAYEGTIQLHNAAGKFYFFRKPCKDSAADLHQIFVSHQLLLAAHPAKL